MPPPAEILSTQALLTLLQQAQESSIRDAAKILDQISLQMLSPHPSTTTAALELLQIHPRPTIAHIPSIISADAATVTSAVETFSALLSSDRTLLVPIIKALSQLPLSPAHKLHTRATLRFALSVVDDEDVPIVLQQLFRSALSAATARWAVSAARHALTRPLAPRAISRVASILSDSARAHTPLGKCLRERPRTRTVLWTDLIVWTAPRLRQLRKQVSASLRAAVSSGALLRDVPALVATIPAAAASLREAPDGVTFIVYTIVQTLHQMCYVEDVLHVAHLIEALVRACPEALPGIVSDLSSPWLASSLPATAILTRLIPIRARLLRRDAPIRNASIAVSQVLHVDNDVSGEDSQVWSDMFIVIRKGLIFGFESDQARAIALSKQIVLRASHRAARELLAIIDSSISGAPSDPLTVAFTQLAASACLRDALHRLQINKYLTRITEQCPPDMLPISEDGTDTLSVDIALIWHQSPAAVADLIPAAVCLKLASTHENARDIIPAMQQVLVLVPVVCLSLYHVADGSSHNFTRWKRNRPDPAQDIEIPDELLETKVDDITTAVLSFATGMASLVGLLNLSCCDLLFCERALATRKTRDSRHPLQPLLERLTEFDRMFNALFLGMRVLTLQQGVKSGKETRKGSRNLERKSIEKVTDVAMAILRSVYLSEDASPASSKQLHSAFSIFPQFTLATVVSSLVAVPDEPVLESLCDEQSGCKRDVELVRIDKLLLRQLVRLVKAFKITEGLDPEVNKFEDSNEPDRVELDTTAFPKDSAKFPLLNDKKSINHDLQDYFLGEESDGAFSDERECGDDSNQVTGSLLWSHESPARDSSNEDYSRFIVYEAAGVERATSQRRAEAGDIVHSPLFAALLLDRAATYVATARGARQASNREDILSDMVTVAGTCLSCLGTILRCTVVFMSKNDKENFSLGALRLREDAAVGAFMKEMDDAINVNIPKEQLKDFSDILPEDSMKEKPSKALAVLHWIAMNSIDVVVAIMAVETVNVISELGWFRKTGARSLALKSLSTVYEYDGKRLWRTGDVTQLLQNNFADWISHRRRIDTNTEGYSSQPCGRDGCSDAAPWIDIQVKSSRLKDGLIEKYRLITLFGGMYIPDALLEACGWVKEMSQVMSRGDPMFEEEIDAEKDRSFKARMSRSGQEKTPASRSSFEKCDILFDMIGFRIIIETLLQLVTIALEKYTIAETYTVEDCECEDTNLFLPILASFRLFCGVLKLFLKNRKALQSTRKELHSSSAAAADEFDYNIATTAICVLQLGRLRIEETLAWYTNESTDVSLLRDASFERFRQLVGIAAESAQKCSDLATAIKMQPSNSGVDTVAVEGAAKSGTRKVPGYAKQKRKRAASTPSSAVSRARRVIPRLMMYCDMLTKSNQKFAKAIGVRALKSLPKLALPAADNDETLHFGIGIIENESDGEMATNQPDWQPLNGGEDQVEESIEDEIEDGFHSKRLQNGKTLEPKTVTVRFR